MLVRVSRPFALLSFAAALLAGAPSAQAQDDVAAAKGHFQKGTRLYEVGDYREALDEFKAAHLAKPDPAFLYNIAQCHRQLGDAGQAVTLYKRFLVASPNAANRTEVERRIAELEAVVGARKDREIPEAAPSAAAPAAVPAPSPAPTSAGASGEAPALASAPAVPPPPSGSSLRYLRWIGAGVTVALVGGAIASGLSASSRFDELERTCGTTAAGCSTGDIDGLKSRALLTNILWGAAGVAAIGTGVAFYLTPSESAVQVAWSF